LNQRTNPHPSDWGMVRYCLLCMQQATPPCHTSPPPTCHIPPNPTLRAPHNPTPLFLHCRFNWVNEAARAKSLVAAGELVIEEEDPFPLGSNSGDGAMPAAVQHTEGVFHRSTQQQKQQGESEVGGRPASRAERLQQGRQSPLDYRVSIN
jgi:hypothetical protein